MSPGSDSPVAVLSSCFHCDVRGHAWCGCDRLRGADGCSYLPPLNSAENPDASKLFPVYGKGAHEYLSLEPFPILGSNRDPAVYEYGQRPSSNSAAYVTIHSGGQMVTPERYMAIVAAAKPDVYVTLCDEVRVERGRDRLGRAR